MPTLRIQTALKDVFIDNCKCAMITRTIKAHLWKKLGYEIPDREFQDEFMHFRETFEYDGMRICHIIPNSVHRYILTDNRYHILNHNHNLKKEINRRKKRIINA